MLRLKEERSSHACWTGATTGAMVSHACSAGAMHNISSMVALTTVLTRVMRISILKVDQQIDDGDGF
jgi:hypothetical protein